jgi:hypothetical protein
MAVMAADSDKSPGARDSDMMSPGRGVLLADNFWHRVGDWSILGSALLARVPQAVDGKIYPRLLSDVEHLTFERPLQV